MQEPHTSRVLLYSSFNELQSPRLSQIQLGSERVLPGMPAAV